MIQFDQASKAVAWADEVLSKPNTKDSVGSLLKKPSNTSLSDVMDHALTISVQMQKVNPILSSSLYRYVYGDAFGSDMEMIIDIFADEFRQDESFEDFTEERILRFTASILRYVRTYENLGQRYPHSSIAKDIGLKRNSLQTIKWRKRIADGRAAVVRHLDRAEKQLTDIFTDKGIIV